MSEVRYLTLYQLRFIHARMIEAYGGAEGERDVALIESAVARPRHSAGGQDAYETMLEKAAALLESLVRNHGFVDGNKRVAYAAVGQFLRLNGWKLSANHDDAEKFMLSAASGELSLSQIVEWLEVRAKPL